MTTADDSQAVERLRESLNDGPRSWEAYDEDNDRYIVDRGYVVRDADLRTVLAECDALRAEVKTVRQARDEAIKFMAKYARQAGEAKGRLEMSEAAGTVEGWREKCDRLRDMIARGYPGMLERIEQAEAEVERVQAESLMNYNDATQLCARLNAAEATRDRYAAALTVLADPKPHYIVQGSPGPLYSAGWAAGMDYAAEIAQRALKEGEG